MSHIPADDFLNDHERGTKAYHHSFEENVMKTYTGDVFDPKFYKLDFPDRFGRLSIDRYGSWFYVVNN